MNLNLLKAEKIILAVTLFYLVFIFSANKSLVIGQTETPTVSPTETSGPTFTPTPTSTEPTTTPSSPSNTPGPTVKASPTVVKKTPTPSIAFTPTLTPTITPTATLTPTPTKPPGFIARGGGLSIVLILAGAALISTAYYLKKRLVK